MKYFFWLILLTAYHIVAQVTIYDAINLSKLNNPTVKSYSLNAEIEKADIQTASLRPNLVFNNQSIFLVDKAVLNLIKPDANLFFSPYASQLWFQVTKQYQIGGKRRAKIQNQTNEYNLAMRDIEEYKNDISYQTALKWLDVWLSKVEMDIILQAESNLDTLLESNIERYNSKLITKNELMRTQILDEQYNILEYAAKQKYNSEVRKLRFMIGAEDDITIDIANDFFYKDIPDEADSLIKYALEYRPDMLSNKARVNISSSSITLNKALAVPNPEIGLISNPQNSIPYLGWYFQMPIPIFDRNQGNIQRAKIEYTQSELQLKTNVNKIKTEITYSIQEYETYRGNSESYRSIEADADEILNTTRSEYLKGKTSIIDYLLVKQNWFEIQKGYYQALYLYRKSYIDLLYVSGLLY